MELRLEADESGIDGPTERGGNNEIHTFMVGKVLGKFPTLLFTQGSEGRVVHSLVGEAEVMKALQGQLRVAEDTRWRLYLCMANEVHRRSHEYWPWLEQL